MKTKHAFFKKITYSSRADNGTVTVYKLFGVKIAVIYTVTCDLKSFMPVAKSTGEVDFAKSDDRATQN